MKKKTEFDVRAVPTARARHHGTYKVICLQRIKLWLGNLVRFMRYWASSTAVFCLKQSEVCLAHFDPNNQKK